MIKQFSINTNQPDFTWVVPDESNTNEKAVHLPDSFDVIMTFIYVEIENYQTALEPQNCKPESLKATTFDGFYVDGLIFNFT